MFYYIITITLYYNCTIVLYCTVLCFSDLPDDKPRITGIKEKYQLGERLEAMCTSWQSHPPANLTWFINEEPVS